MPQRFMEGFTVATQGWNSNNVGLIAASEKNNMLTHLIPRRGDVGPGQEVDGYQQDRRYFDSYADVQRYGVKNDFCRMLIPQGGGLDETFFACALAGTINVSSISFKTKTHKEGLRLSRDDYMRAILKDGRDAYCRILQQPTGDWQPMCLPAQITSFGNTDIIDPDPPDDIAVLLDFYSGCRLWLRLRDDMIDYIGGDKTLIQYAGGCRIDEAPRPTITRGLYFNGIDQFVRIGDQYDLTMGSRIKLRTTRAFSVWVRFTEFTNNAHIFDFGNGAGKGNVFLGILGKGDAAGADQASIRPGPACQDSTVPAAPSGAQWCPEIRPDVLMATSSANVDEYVCPGPEEQARKLSRLETRPIVAAGTGGNRATLLYEVWDSRLRKMQIKLSGAIPKGQWTHIVVTADTMDVAQPNIQVYINGNLYWVEQSGCLPQEISTDHNYLGKSNWADDSSSYELRDELLSGSIYDFRMYGTVLGETKVKRILQYGMNQLGLDTSFLTSTPST